MTVLEGATQKTRATTSPEMAKARGPKPATWLSSASDHELSFEAAAKLLHVSPTHLCALADAGVFGLVRLTKEGHRLLPKAGVLSFRAESRGRQARGLKAAMAATRKLGLYDAELAGLPLARADKR